MTTIAIAIAIDSASSVVTSCTSNALATLERSGERVGASQHLPPAAATTEMRTPKKKTVTVTRSTPVFNRKI